MPHPFIRALRRFVYTEGGKRSHTAEESVGIDGAPVPFFVNEFWTSRQRQAHSLHEVSYRACFKPQLPRFFIERLTAPGDVVYDPFSGRGTTVLEAALAGRRIIANDVNPLSRLLSRPRIEAPSYQAVAERLESIPYRRGLRPDIPLSMFFHRDTLAEILSLRAYLRSRHRTGREDAADRWIRMVATNRLTGHSSGFFSVYTLPPNQAVSPQRQRLINRSGGRRPEYRDTKRIILKKSRLLLKELMKEEAAALRRTARYARFLTGDARRTEAIPRSSVRLTVTSPPFLDIVQYAQDNWLRCWFNGIDAEEVGRTITMSRTVEEWNGVMGEVFRELYRITRREGWVVFEVGEVRNGTVRLEEEVVRLGRNAGFVCEGVMINRQRFTKTANIWGVRNNRHGTNSNRIVLFRKGGNP
ncbi:MAG: site-specific DNA-methyltransferase [Bacteroidetes bacterium]|nr:MAG: site-specific DNA-methyltransferase [Bacteroidota bacterium]